jgi:hypothetical protein
MAAEFILFTSEPTAPAGVSAKADPAREPAESQYRYDQPELDPEGRSGVMGSLFGPRTFRDGRVQVWGCSPGCLLLSLAVSVVLTLLLNLLLDFL